jgi:hypothetical protein
LPNKSPKMLWNKVLDEKMAVSFSMVKTFVLNYLAKMLILLVIKPPGNLPLPGHFYFYLVIACSLLPIRITVCVTVPCQ